ncbi:hypothetical protein [Brevifollis gellanilyticus]|uniref:Uncharacterized protein n=1 Tax=Brevifollis gellanilyticus TaxID=748831 RepID=A0A512MGT9_9BACT|nr:hypothetical protein [Brevifollis gellanilyticus]GEP45939.1 hypothetical protein BGE01nite_52300 [Brevifollis gellanilyticus]
MTLHAGTDAGNVVAFDPAALPDDYDTLAKDDPMTLIERLHDEGRLRWIDPHSDGSYRLGVFVGQAMPERLAPYLGKGEVIEQFHTPSGRLWFTGIEYVFRHDDSFLRKYPHQGASVEVPAGVHKAVFYELEYPEDFEETLLAQHLSPEQLAARKRMNRFAPLGCLGALAIIIGFFLLSRYAWVTTVLPVGLMAIAIPFLLSRSRSHRSSDAATTAITDDYPDYALHIQPNEI